eukprot:NODE_808_length_751_cov_1.503185_g799_i0.p1 GENE.NODE_808_length_751_cov_1.503185_g799_i0~~NODE_808_length_751_cov_1.503185_g799_i0.p1  ORF type:complete len:180 (+),score=57.48 NODE_808_length_751_cov_1.503185_g799_i0:164-703(+)
MMFQFDGKQPEAGRETYVSELAHVIGDVVIGDHCYIGHGAIVRGDYGRIEIGDGTAVEEGVIIHAPPGDVCRIGKRVTLGHGAVIHGRRIGDMAVIGMGAVLSLFSEVGAGAIVAEGGIVTANQIVEDRVVAAGNPARTLRSANEKDMEFWSLGKQLYIDLAKKYLENPMTPVGPGLDP